MRGPRPNLTWYLFNLFRLVAVVFMVWALVAQFVALATDIAEVTKSKSSSAQATSASPAAGSASASSSTRRNSSSTASIGPSPILITASRPRTTANVATPTLARVTRTTSVEPVGTLSGATTPALVRPVTPVTSDTPLTVPRPIRRSALSPLPIGKRAEGGEEVKPTSGVHGSSNIPTTSGGILFASASRIIMATLLTFLLLVQLGVPELWLYKHASAFGPQSTPLWLGVGQVIIAVEGLRVYSIPLVWSAHAGLLVIGMINSHLALALIFLAKRRKLPKFPSPPLYFSRTTRLLFFRPLPACYAQLLSKEELEAVEAEASGNPPEYPKGAFEAEQGQGPPRRSRWFHRESRAPTSDREDGLTDVRQGGYPTFARGGLGASGSQIPTGTIDRAADGRIRGIVARPPVFGEPGGPGGMGRDRRSLETAGDAYSGYADDESRAPSRNEGESEPVPDLPPKHARDGNQQNLGGGLKGRRKPAPLGLGLNGDAGTNPTLVAGDTLVSCQQSIKALRDKIHQRMERKASLETGTETAAPQDPLQAPDGTRGIPTITTTVPSAGLSATALIRPPKRSATIDSVHVSTATGSGSRQQPTVLRAIPKRGNTISQMGPGPTPKPQLPARGSSRSKEAHPPPPPIAKSPPPKSGTESMFSSILPWNRPSRAPSPNEPVPKLPEVPSSQAISGLGLGKQGTKESSTGGISNGLQPHAQGLSRTPSGSKLQKSKMSGATSPNAFKAPTRSETVLLASKPVARDDTKHSSSSSSLVRQDTLSVSPHPERGGSPAIGRRSPNTLVKSKSESKKRSSPLALALGPSSSSPASPIPIRPQSSQGILQTHGPSSSLRSSMAPLNRNGSMRSTRSTRTAMGVRFNLEKRYSSSSSESDAERESLLSPDTGTTSTPRSAGESGGGRFRIPGTKINVPFPGTQKRRDRSISNVSTGFSSRPCSPIPTTASISPGLDDGMDSGLLLDMDDSSVSELEAARPESFASRSSTSSMWFDKEGNRGPVREDERELTLLGDRAGLPKRSASVMTEMKPSRKGTDPMLGGHGKSHRRRPSSTSIDLR